MPIFSHNIYENVRTRVIVLHEGRLLLLEPHAPGEGWQVPGGGLEPNECLADCAEREVFEETGLQVKVTGTAFLREFVVPKYCILPDDNRVGYGLEVFLYAHPVTDQITLRAEYPGAQPPHWIALEQVPKMPLWPKELKTLAQWISSGHMPQGVPNIVSQLESPDAEAPGGIHFA